VVRFDGARVRAFENVCAHRHCRVVAPGRGRGGTLRCAYHGWEYGADGAVSRVPDGASFRGFRAEGLRLRELPVEVLGALVFVRSGEPGEPLRESLGELGGDIERFFGDHRCIWRWTTEHDVNWKVIAENAVESYHVPATHRHTFRDYRPPELHDHDLAKRYTRYRDLKPWTRRPSELLLRGFHRVLLPGPDGGRFTQAHVFPSHLLYYGDLFSLFIALEPLGPRRTRHVLHGFVPRRLRSPWLRPLQELFAAGFVPAIRRVLREDMRLWDEIQAGLEASRHEGVLSAREERVWAFQRFVRDAVAEESG
jgi:phenylpropionate dioxygenase-like ring-hydroxylating dioxygenase large terminal subunit